MRYYTREEVENWKAAKPPVNGRIEAEGKIGFPVVIVGGPFGSTMYLHGKDESLTPHLAKQPYWESWITSWVTRELVDAVNFVDVGANCGYYSAVAMGSDANVIAIEANPQYQDLLYLTSFDSEWDMSRFFVLEVAISDEYGTAYLHVPESLHGGASLYGDNGNTIEVPMRRMDDYINHSGFREGKTVVKLDIEGAEEAWFRGASAFLSKYRPTIVMEYTPGAYSDAFYGLLSAYGTLTRVNHQGHDEGLSESDFTKSGDWFTIAIRPHAIDGFEEFYG